MLSARSVFYVTAGVAWIDADYSARNGDGFISEGRLDIDEVGFVAGGGMEHAITDALSLRIEGLHYAFGDLTDTSTLTVDSDPGDAAGVDDITVVRAAVNLRLGAH